MEELAPVGSVAEECGCRVAATSSARSLTQDSLMKYSSLYEVAAGRCRQMSVRRVDEKMPCQRGSSGGGLALICGRHVGSGAETIVAHQNPQTRKIDMFSGVARV